jgi:glucarate dehydratase
MRILRSFTGDKKGSAAIEFACLDIIGQKLGVPVHALLGGKLRETVDFASYLFFRYADPAPARRGARPSTLPRPRAEEGTASGAQAQGGVYPPAHELACYARWPPRPRRPSATTQQALSLADAIDFGRGIEDLANDYFEDPVWGMPQLARLKEFVSIPIATNTVVVNFEQLAANVEMRAVDVVLLDTTFWGGIRPCIKAAGVCETMGIGVAVHSSGELGIQLATMLHLGAVLPNLGYAADAHYHHLTDDVIAGGKMAYENGAIRVPDGHGLGIVLDRAKLAQYHERYRELGGYPYDRDPGRPGWYPLVPNHDWADPTRSLSPKLSGGR